MSDSWFVTPETDVIPLPGGQWIEVKKRLTVGEERSAFQAIVGEVNQAGWRRPNVEMIGLAEVAAYLVGWSLTQGAKPVQIDTDGLKIAALKALHPSKYKLIEDAITAHIEKMDAAEAAEKNGQGGGTAPVPTSPSAAPSAGPTAS
jgi:hypothetical protein